LQREITFCENKIHVLIEIADDGDVRLLHLSSLDYRPIPEEKKARFRMLELQLAGHYQGMSHNVQYTDTCPGALLRYADSRDFRNRFGRKLEIDMKSESVEATCHLQFYDDMAVVRSWCVVRNCGNDDEFLVYLSSFCLKGISKEGILDWDSKSCIMIPHTTWQGEAHWQTYTAAAAGLQKVGPDSGAKRLNVHSLGTWSSGEYLPMGYYENMYAGSGYLWQIEHNGSWQWEIGDEAGELYLQLSGPNENEGHWCKRLSGGETFESVPVAVAAVTGGFEVAAQEMTRYRRVIRRPNDDDQKLPVIFNDYMNCLWGDPSTEAELPLIDAAKEAGCEYYVIDAGWYADGGWWDTVGEWLPSEKRFPGGLKKLMDVIRSKGLVPGLWLEIEVMGVHCPLADKLPDSWFFMRRGKRVVDKGRYQLDFRNPEVAGYAAGIVDRLVGKYGAGYIKMDYNINPGSGTELQAESFGDGLCGHNRAYLRWLDGIWERYPQLVIENCSSGGMRLDYAMLSRHSILSSSDQTDYRRYAKIASNILTDATPEQIAVWSYPLADGDCEETIFNMVNAMLLRIHQSGFLTRLSDERFSLVKEGIECYKRIRNDIPNALPFWPLGLSDFRSEWISFGLSLRNKAYLALYRMQSSREHAEIPVRQFKGQKLSVACIYPKARRCEYEWNPLKGTLTVAFPQNYCARLFELNLK
jgi:alpha-galactosidase